MKKSQPCNFATARANMVDGQLKPNRITNKALLAAFAAVPRELFVLPAHQTTAYADAPQPIGAERFMPSTLQLAHLLQELDIHPHTTVLVVGVGTGYTAAILSHLAAHVVAIESDKKLLETARNTLLDIGVSNVRLLQAEPTTGAPRHAPFHAIVSDIPLTHTPPALLAQLTEGGKLAAIKQSTDGLWEATIITKHASAMFEKPLFETKTPPVLPAPVAESFVF